ncbi:MAG: ABC transporter substrate-binding protein [Actinobacteria bacterium]|nr:ABC transporter substrate-binding protein [Actinomycetota bacterium]
MVLAAIIFSLLVRSCGKNNDVKIQSSIDATTAESTESGKYLNPFAFLIEDKVSGFDIDIAGEIAKRLGRELKISQISWNEIFDRINDAGIDAIISGVSNSVERQKTTDFSEPYYTLEFISLTLNSSIITLKEELVNKKVGMLKNEMENLSPDVLSNYSITGYDDVVALIKGLKAEEIQGIIISIPIGVKILNEDPDTYRFINKMESSIKYSIVLKKGSPLTDRINQVLKEIKDDGTYKKIYDNWFKI